MHMQHCMLHVRLERNWYVAACSAAGELLQFSFCNLAMLSAGTRPDAGLTSRMQGWTHPSGQFWSNGLWTWGVSMG